MELKKPLSFEEQAERLAEHKIDTSSFGDVRSVVKQTGYYRLSGYSLQYRRSATDSDCVDGTTFGQVYAIYSFDQDLRHLLRKYLEITEVYYKSLIGTTFALIKCKDAPHDQHYDQNNFHNKTGYQEVMDSLEKEGKSYYRDSLIMKHHKQKYSGKMPLWVMLELLSFSNTSKLFSAMWDSEQTAIAKHVGVSNKTLENHLHCLSVLRNKCAHCARLYNTVMNPPVHMAESFLKRHPEVKNDSVFAYIHTLHKRLPNRAAKQEMYEDIISLLNRYKTDLDLSLIGFPDNYEELLQFNI